MEDIDEKVRYILEFAEEFAVPILEVVFELSFREILKPILEQLFSEEVKQLKYFKTTHDNFTALSFAYGSAEDNIQKILDALGKKEKSVSWRGAELERQTALIRQILAKLP